MTIAGSLIPGLDEIVRNGDPERRAEAARRITELFLLGAANFRPDHVELFDGVLIGLEGLSAQEVAQLLVLRLDIGVVDHASHHVSDGTRDEIGGPTKR